MEKKTLVIVIVLAALAGAAGLILHNRQDSSQPRNGSIAGQKVLPEFDPNAITRITIQAAEGRVTLAREKDGWTVVERANYPANFDLVSDTIRDIWDLKAVQEVPAGPSQFPRLRLVKPAPEATDTGTLVEFFGAGPEPVAALLLGKESFLVQPGQGGSDGIPNGRFVLPAGSTGPVALVSESFATLLPNPQNWIRREFIRPGNFRSITATGGSAKDWQLTKDSESSDWKLTEPTRTETPDPAKLNAIPPTLPPISILDVAAPDETIAGFESPRTLTLKTWDGFTYTLRAGQPQADRIPVTVEVTADLPRTREPAADEKPEDKEKLDQAFADNLRTLEEKLATESRFAGRTFWIPAASLTALLRDRTELLTTPEQDVTTEPVAAPTPKPSKTSRPKNKTGQN